MFSRGPVPSRRDLWSDLIGRPRDSGWKKTVENNLVFLAGAAVTPRSSGLKSNQIQALPCCKGDSREEFHEMGQPYAGNQADFWPSPPLIPPPA